MIKIPQNGKWTQLNNSDRFGSLAYTKNVNLDEEGYLKLSPRAVNIFDDSGDVTNVSDSDFDVPVSFGRYGQGDMRIATTDEPFNMSVSTTSKLISEDSDASNPSLATNSHGVWWQNNFYESTSTAVYANNSGSWTANVITGLSSSYRHTMCVFRSRNTLLVSNGSVVKQYDTGYAASTDLTLPSDFEVVGIAYNNNKVGIITRLGSDTEGQNAEAYFFIWDGATTSANAGFSLGSIAAFSIVAYKSSFAIATSAGQLLYFNGGGFQELAHFPYYASDRSFGDFNSYISYGDNMVVVGDLIYINIRFDFNALGKKQEVYEQNNPSGVWCYDPKVGLYHRYSASNSKAYLHNISQANVNLTTNTFTTTGVIPLTGNPIVLTNGSVGGLTIGEIYYVIRISSTTFKIAETKEDADALNAIDITSADTNQYFYMYDIIDYGASLSSITGGIATWGNSNLAYKDIVFGLRIFDTSLNTQATLCMTIPTMENRGYFVLPKILTNNPTEEIQKVYIKHRPLDEKDAIILKVKTKDILGLPTSSPNNASSESITWTSSTTGTTTTNLSEAKTAFDAGEELELELTAGIGAGQMVKVTNLTESSGTYTITVEDSIVGYSSGLKSQFSIDNWRVYKTADYDSQTNGLFEVAIGVASKSIQLKIELRGYNTTIEDISIITEAHQQ